MFESRLRFLLIVLAVPTLILILRLGQLQLFTAHDAQDQAQALLRRPPQYFPALRGSITDRFGTKLAYDAPSWDIEVYYSAMATDCDGDGKDDSDFLEYIDPLAWREVKEQARKAQEMTLNQARDVIKERINESWITLARLAGRPRRDLLEIGDTHVRRVQRIKQAVERIHNKSEVIAEERQFYPIQRRLTQAESVDARMELRDYPWMRVRKTHARQYDGGAAVGHLLGHLAEVNEEVRQADPYRDDPLRQYLLGEQYGRWGIERLGDERMRGMRGMKHVDRTGAELSPPVEPIDGSDFRLTIDMVLQRALQNQLAAAVEQTAHRSGGSAVLLDIPTREILAIVNYPAPHADPLLEGLHEFTEEDRIHQRYLFRAIGSYYPPGSIVKPMVCAAALTEGVIAPDTQLECQGKLFAGSRTWSCEGIHGMVEPIFSIQHSCNIFYYKVGERMGVDLLSQWMSRFGFGRTTGSRLSGEMPGRLPTDHSKGGARNMGIGQGMLDITPLQAANMAATLASGVHQPVTIDLHDPTERVRDKLDVPDAYWRIVREGMYQAVNVRGGTAFGENKGQLTDVDDYVLIGKTGSAQAWARTIDYTFTLELPDITRVEVVAYDKAEALKKHPDAKVVGRRSHRRWPDVDPLPTHAWFVGYLVRKDRYLQSIGPADDGIAVAVVIEYSGHGGDIAAPVAKKIMQAVVLKYFGQSNSGSRQGVLR